MAVRKSSSPPGKKTAGDEEKKKTVRAKKPKTGETARSRKKKQIEEPEEPERSFAPVVVPPEEVVGAKPAVTSPPPAEAVEAKEPAPAVEKPAEKRAEKAAPPEEPKAAPPKPSVKPAAKPKPFFPKTYHPPQPPPSRRPAPPPPPKRHDRHKSAPHRSPTPVAPPPSDARESKTIAFNEMMTVGDLAKSMEVKVGEVIRKLLGMGTPASINQRVEPDMAALIAEAFGFHLNFKSIYVEEKAEEKEPEEKLKPRPPVVTVMGHVDHGKTSLLDAIRSASVVSGEAGGITQHIGAYQVKTSKGFCTFLDTPGHEAFTAMRARGAQATDLVVLVVAADDGVKPQTLEAIDHAKAADVPVVVAINKMDLPQANSQRVKQELSQHNLLAEDWGGKTVMVEVSARANQNMDKLLEMIMLEAELLELKANPDRPARGVVLEARVDPRRGVTTTVLVQAGTLRVGDVVVCGLSHGRVRAMLDEHAQQVEAAGPSKPVEILGLQQVPQVGDQLSVVTSDREAREIAERRRLFVEDGARQKAARLSLESLHSRIAEGKVQDLKVILKADVQGSLQAIQDSLMKISNPSIQIRFVHTGVGNINESDVLLAEASEAVVFGFSVKIETKAEAEAKRAGVEVRTYKIIYEMLADVRAAMEGLLKPMEVENVIGRALVKNVFPSSRFGAVLGCMIQDGKAVRGSRGRLRRGGKEVALATVSSLRRFKDDVKEVEKGYECGLALEGVKNAEPGDEIEFFVIEKQARRLED